MNIKKDTVVTMAYQLMSIPQGEKNEEITSPDILLEERNADDPLEFIYGHGTLLKVVEDKILNQSAGYISSLVIYPEVGYGLYNPDLQTWIELSRFPKGKELKLGMKFQTQGPNGDAIAVIVKEIKEERALIDGNHPLAGLVLRFDLRIIRVREATAQEMATGQVNNTLYH